MAKKILIVDDEANIVKLLKNRLKKIGGYKVIVAQDGQDGLELARNEKPDLILLDLMLPKLNGYKLCRMLKFDQKYKHIPIIIFTARAQKSDEKLGLEVGANAYITKPFRSETLLTKIKELLKD